MLGLGAGGHGVVVLEILREAGRHDVVGFLDPRGELWGTQVAGVPVLGDDDLLEAQYHAGVRTVFMGLGGTRDNGPRRRLYEHARGLGFEVAGALHSRAAVSPSAVLGEGAVVAAGAVVGSRAVVGDNAIVNSGAVVEHDCVVGAHAHVATGARLGGEVAVGEGAHVGLGASVLQGVRIGAGALVGAGAVVLRDVPDGVAVVGVPARPLERRR